MYSSCWHRKYSSELFIATAVTFLLWAPPLHAQQDRVPKHEFRGAWIATVINLDWPSSRNASSHTQQRNLTDMIDGLKEAGINAVFFQVRSEADAMYASGIEPWSFWLTGEQGASPEPFYDPLEVAIEEAHKRGVELHAWINPYRASRGSSYEKAADHITKRYPQWVLTFGNIATLNPGLPEVRNHIARVIMDIVRRYDIDGVHFDDYFYPYPPNNISTEDSGTFAEHNRGITSIADWRRDNVNLLVAQVADSIRAVKPHVKFGISPFGILEKWGPCGDSRSRRLQCHLCGSYSLAGGRHSRLSCATIVLALWRSAGLQQAGTLVAGADKWAPSLHWPRSLSDGFQHIFGHALLRAGSTQPGTL